MGELSFASPLLLIALAGLPAIWLLLRATPPTPRQVRFPAFDLLRRLAKTPETPHRSPWWILLLRMLIAGLAIVGLSGPILNAPPAPASGGPIIIVVDNSWAAAPGWRLRRDTMQTLAEQTTRAGREAYFIAAADADDKPAGPLTGAELAERAAATEPAPFLPDYRRTLEKVRSIGSPISNAEIIWLSDGLDHQGARELRSALETLGAVTLRIDDKAPIMALRPPGRTDARLSYRIDRIGAAPARADLVAIARNGRELARASVDFPAGAASVEAALDLPLALQNDMAMTRIDAQSSAGAVQLVDARERRTLIGFIAGASSGVDPLLSGEHYVRTALAPYAAFVSDTLENLIASDASAIVLDDVGVLRASDADALAAWIERGGVLIRFAGPTLSETAADSAPALLPVRLRGGGRAFGGALTWETPQPIAAFSEQGPFADMVPPTDVLIRRQVLAEPGAETSERSWASLSDGTPLVTGETIGAGAVALFHVTATPDWSDLPLSSTFLEMLRKLAYLSALGPRNMGEESARSVSPFRVLDGFGVLRQPARDFEPVTIAEIASGPAPGRPPGLYGAAEAPIALNAVGKDDVFEPVSPVGASVLGYVDEPPLRVGPPLFVIALLLLIADCLVALRIAGRLSFAAALAMLFAVLPADPAAAEPLDRPIAPRAVDAALAMRLAYVKTGDPATDRISEAGLRGLSLELTRRTSAEPAPPVGIDPETDDLSVFPFLYWPLTAGASAPSEAALANVESFMRYGGLIVFDTRDDERTVAGADTPEGAALKAILGALDLPPLATVPEDHVLNRSFYLLSDLSGRMAARPVWVQSGDGPNDSVTPVIIGGRDWAGAWAINDAGEPLLPVRSGVRPCANARDAIPRPARECAYRAGVNMVMVALTGNYKSDQVHTPILLERLGKK